jgi:hypothetical protein
MVFPPGGLDPVTFFEEILLAVPGMSTLSFKSLQQSAQASDFPILVYNRGYEVGVGATP